MKKVAIPVQICGLLVGLIGLMAVVGYIAGEPVFYRWNPRHASGMPINTAISFILEGFGLILAGKYFKDHG